MAGEVPALSTGVVLVIAVAVAGLGACRGAATTPRERVLAGLPGDAIAVVAADGRSLSDSRIRGALDAVAARWPASLSCVVDTAVASDAVALTVDRAGNTAVLIALSRPPRCLALSQRAPGLWIATLGAGPPAQAASVLDDPRFARARPYLTRAPIAAAVLGDVHLLAAAQPDPLDAWVAIDVAGSADAVAQAVAAQIAQLAREPRTAALAGALRVERPGASQLVVHLSGAVPAASAPAAGSPAGAAGELATAVRAVLAWADAERGRGPPAGPAFRCPAPGPGIRCDAGTLYRVASLAADLGPIVAAGRPAPVVVNGSITGLRLGAAVPGLGLDAGDEIVAVAGRLVTSRTMLADRIARARAAITVTVRRGAEEAVLQFAER
ncbi:MAG TPA: hypothetical protein VHT91_40930 [Kofleriaceae bacterium]|jgi:hypothetical protein|nr:hypothetical protein [Kofleriaceae bacterium]